MSPEAFHSSAEENSAMWCKTKRKSGRKAMLIPADVQYKCDRAKNATIFILRCVNINPTWTQSCINIKYQITEMGVYMQHIGPHRLNIETSHFWVFLVK